MKKKCCSTLVVSTVLAICLSACSLDGSGSGDGAGDFEWTREGTFTEGEAENVLMVYKSDDPENYPGWSVTFVIDDEVHGWFVEQNGATLEGNLTADYLDEPDYFVTITEEGEDGLLLVTKDDGKEYHFLPYAMPEVLATVSVNTEGLGQIAVAEGEDELVFDDEFPTQSFFANIAEPTQFQFAAQADEDWVFVKWTCNGEDYATDETISVLVEEDMDFVAVFEFEE